LKVLLDTNALIWLIDQTDMNVFGPSTLEIIQDAEVVYVSSISILEIRIKTMLGKLTSEEDLLDDIKAAGLKNLSFSPQHADAICSFPNLFKHDPFDRMLLAQAQSEELVLLTTDKLLIDLNLPFVVNARK
jgi:PIN domain nuclease of toxin-antitoxin system